MLIDGIQVPLTESFYRDGRSYLRKLEHNVGRYSLTPAAGLVALPPGGEAAGLSDAERLESLRVVGQTAAASKVLIAGIEQESVRDALVLAEQAAECGFDGLLVGAPPSWPRWKRAGAGSELLVYFRAIADAVTLPVLLWSEVAAPSCQISVEEIGELAGHANILGVYDADLTPARHRAIVEKTQGVKREVTVTTVFTPVTRRMMVPEASAGAATFVSAAALGGGGGAALAVAPPVAAVKTRTKTVGFQIMAAGDASTLLPLLDAGVAGAMPRLAACAPQACHEVYAAFKDGNPELAAEKGKRLLAADELLRELGVAGIKYGCDLNGYYGGTPRLPRLPLDAAERAHVERVLASLKN